MIKPILLATTMLFTASLAMGSSIAFEQLSVVAQQKSQQPEPEIKNNYYNMTPMQRLAHDYDIVVFYKSTCPHCQKFEPVLESFAKQYGFEVYPYSIDQQPLPGQTTYLNTTPEVLNMFFGNVHTGIEVPATFIINKNNLDKRYWIGIGEMTQSQLLDQFQNYANSIEQ